jgi:uncharacterized iron-regulated protein
MKRAARLARIETRRFRELSSVWAALTGLALAGCAAHDSTPSTRPLGLLSESSLLRARVIYVAEKHNESSHHQLQKKIIRSLQQRDHSLTVGMEMIDVTQQRALDQYLEKKTSWTTFARSTAFESGWGRTSPAYKRILEWCRRNQVPVLGINATQSVTRKIARNQKLTSAESALIPKFPEPPGGFQKFQAAMVSHPGFGSLRRYYQAQRARDATMARTILSWIRNHQGTLVVLLGEMHADAQTGVPWYVARNSAVSQLIIHPKE